MRGQGPAPFDDLREQILHVPTVVDQRAIEQWHGRD
jgi:hypothetical protein